MIAKVIYKMYLKTQSKLLASFLWKIRQCLLRLYNPIISLEYKGFHLKMPFSHTIFAYQKQYPHYDMNLGKIAKFIKNKSGFLNMVDVGANIGDTAVFVKCGGAFLLIEGSKNYANLIEANLKANYQNIYNMQNIQNGGGQ